MQYIIICKCCNKLPLVNKMEKSLFSDIYSLFIILYAYE